MNRALNPLHTLSQEEQVSLAGANWFHVQSETEIWPLERVHICTMHCENRIVEKLVHLHIATKCWPMLPTAANRCQPLPTAANCCQHPANRCQLLSTAATRCLYC